jgi:diguanylate cyclase (GGDEF)-like protein
MSRLYSWWQQPDQFDAMTAFLRQRGLLRSAQRIMATVAVSSALAPLSMLTSQRHLQEVGGVIIGAFTLMVAVFWLTRWPTRRQSETLVLAGAGCIVWWSLTQSWPGIAALGCTALAVTGAYIAVFHSTKMLVLHFLVALGAAAVTALRLAQVVDVATALGVFWLICFPNLSVCLGIWGLAQAMGTYAQRAGQDALTGLLNRRGFIDTITQGDAQPLSGQTHLTMLMVDLDDFKRINDTHGHAVGDSVLLAVADLLREHTPSTAVICRAGGEEFLIAVRSTAAEPEPLADRLCAAIARLPQRITASVGAATTELHRVSQPDCSGVLEQLMAAADAAMYAAKRNGGDQSRYLPLGFPA